MPNDDGRNPIPNDKGKGHMFSGKGKGHMFNAFQNLSLCNINSDFEQAESSNRNNPILNFQCNIGRLSVQQASPRLSAAARLRAPPSPWISQTRPSSSINSGRPSASPESLASSDIDLDLDLDVDQILFRLLKTMTVPRSYSEFLGLLRTIDTYQEAERESLLSRLGSLLTTDQSAFIYVATNQSGSHALRTLLKRSPKLDGLIFIAVCRNFWSLMNNKHGRFLIVPTIRAVDKSRKEILYMLTYRSTLLLAQEETGCVALNDVFQEIRGPLRDQIARNAGWLAFDPYGTHVVQNFLTLQNPRATQGIAASLFGSFFRLATERLGSYVVEKCLNSEFGREKVLEEFRGNDKEWVRMANDKFGNFVAQCALRTMKQSGMKQMLREFVEKLRPHFGEMRVGPGKNTVRVIEEEIEESIRESSGMEEHSETY